MITEERTRTAQPLKSNDEEGVAEKRNFKKRRQDNRVESYV
jgi:hypothetical protein